jgi:glycosyltransferase involved in cell wall biosynthesis
MGRIARPDRPEDSCEVTVKVVVQIPCLNEEETLPLVLSSIPRQIDGVDEVIVLVIDDGSHDRTVEVARAHGVTQFVHHTERMGLARSFRDGVERALELGADIIVNTDGDNQYPQERIGDLCQPVIHREADIVVADRQTDKIAHFSPFKKKLQAFGSRVVNAAAGTDIPDAASGFRAYSREAAIRLNTITKFSYCMETIIQAGNKQLAVKSLPVEVNPKTRESRLFKSNWEHVSKSGFAITRAYMMYKPYVFFMTLSGVLFVLGLIPFVRYLVIWIDGMHGSHIQSLILGVTLLIAAALSLVLGVVADLIRTNRILIEESLEQIKRSRFSDPSLELMAHTNEVPDWRLEAPEVRGARERAPHA